MIVFYYTSVSYLDSAIEIINAIKHAVKLHVVIEIAPETKGTNLLNVGSLTGLPTLATPEQVLDEHNLRLFQPYFDGTASVQFFVQQNPKTFSLESFRNCRDLSKYINSVQPDFIHFDTAKARALGLLPFLYRKFRDRVVITIHDPVPHSGEFNWRNFFVTKGFYPLAARFIFYSNFSQELFKSAFPAYGKRADVVKMHPLSFHRKLRPEQDVEKSTVLFFGRISPYKGVDIFLKAIPMVLKRFPEQKFVIAGSKTASFELDATHITEAGNKLQLILNHLSNEQLVELVDNAKFVVCPYLDATQSGVLMTTFAYHTGVIASEVGAFPEFIKPGVNGELCNPGDAEELASAIIQALKEKQYIRWTENLKKYSSTNEWLNETERIHKIYKGEKV
jgi:glycosyltransferase involved in cell wall biosynthesis